MNGSAPSNAVRDARLDRLTAAISATSRVFGAWRRRRAAARLAGLGTPVAMVALAEAFIRSPDQQVVDIARRALRAARDQEVIDAVAGTVVSTGNERLAAIVKETGRAPSDPGRHAVVLFLTGDFERYADLDFDGSLLRGAYAGAGEALRRPLAEKARAGGRLEWVRAVATPGDVNRQRSLTATEWEAAIQVLAGAQRWEELWRLALEAPAVWAARMLRIVRERGWQPPGERERAAFAALVKLAAKACAADIPAATDFADENVGVAGQGGQVQSLTVTPDGTLLISGGYQDVVRLWLLSSGQQLGTLPATNVLTMATTRNGNLLITGDMSGNINLWRLRSRAPGGESRHIAAEPVGNYVAARSGRNMLLGRKVLALAVTPDGGLLASAGYGQYVQLWRISSSTLTPAAAIAADRQWIPCLAVTPDGRTLVSGGGTSGRGNLRLWRLPSGGPVGALAGHTSHVSCLGITPDGTLLASGGYDSTVRLWHLPSGEPAGVLTGHTGNVLSMAVTPDGKLLASAGDDRVVRLWHLPSGAPAGELPGHRSRIECLAVSPDGQLLASGAADGYLRWWTRRRSPLETLVSTPLGEVSPAEVSSLERSSRHLSADERTWLTLIAALVRWRQRHDVELVDVAPGAGATPWDVELGDGAEPSRQGVSGGPPPHDAQRPASDQRRSRPKRRSKKRRTR